MYWILEKETETTLAMSHFKNIAKLIALLLPCKCVVRYTPDHAIYPANTDFELETKKNQKKCLTSYSDCATIKAQSGKTKIKNRENTKC